MRNLTRKHLCNKCRKYPFTIFTVLSICVTLEMSDFSWRSYDFHQIKKIYVNKLIWSIEFFHKATSKKQFSVENHRDIRVNRRGMIADKIRREKFKFSAAFRVRQPQSVINDSIKYFLLKKIPVYLKHIFSIYIYISAQTRVNKSQATRVSFEIFNIRETWTYIIDEYYLFSSMKCSSYWLKT